MSSGTLFFNPPLRLAYRSRILVSTRGKMVSLANWAYQRDEKYLRKGDNSVIKYDFSGVISTICNELCIFSLI